MGVKVISDNKTIEFESTGGSIDTQYYAAIMRNDGIIEGMFQPTVNISSSQSWCHPSLGDIKDNTGKQIKIQCDRNTETEDQTADVYVTYNGKKSSRYIIVKIKGSDAPPPPPEEPEEPEETYSIEFDNPNPYELSSTTNVIGGINVVIKHNGVPENLNHTLVASSENLHIQLTTNPAAGRYIYIISNVTTDTAYTLTASLENIDIAPATLDIKWSRQAPAYQYWHEKLIKTGTWKFAPTGTFNFNINMDNSNNYTNGWPISGPGPFESGSIYIKFFDENKQQITFQHLSGNEMHLIFGLNGVSGKFGITDIDRHGGYCDITISTYDMFNLISGETLAQSATKFRSDVRYAQFMLYPGGGYAVQEKMSDDSTKRYQGWVYSDFIECDHI